MTDLVGLIKLGFYVLTHPIGTYRFMRMVKVLIRSLTLDVAEANTG